MLSEQAEMLIDLVTQLAVMHSTHDSAPLVYTVGSTHKMWL